jgi:hypothetical protein
VGDVGGRRGQGEGHPPSGSGVSPLRRRWPPAVVSGDHRRRPLLAAVFSGDDFPADFSGGFSDDRRRPHTSTRSTPLRCIGTHRCEFHNSFLGRGTQGGGGSPSLGGGLGRCEGNVAGNQAHTSYTSSMHRHTPVRVPQLLIKGDTGGRW